MNTGETPWKNQKTHEVKSPFSNIAYIYLDDNLHRVEDRRKNRE
jgi:hypothetical protein